MIDTDVEEHVRQALSAAAERIASAGESTARPVRPRRRLAPVLIAAVVVAVAVTGTILINQNQRHRDEVAAGIVNVTQGVASVDGIQFPVPSGWSVWTVSHDADASTVCVAPTPPAPLCSAVQLRVAIAGRNGSITALPGSPLFDSGSKEKEITIDSSGPVAGRPGVREHFVMGGGSTATLWSTNDLALEITVRGEALVPQAERIVAGLDLTRWAHAYGPQLAFFGPADSAVAGPTG